MNGKETAVKLWAAIRGVKRRAAVPVSAGSAQPTQEEKHLNETIITHSPEVRALLDKLRQARESGAVIAADLAQAESVIAGLTVERGRLKSQLRASEKELASSGALPDGPFPEESEIHDVNRQIRVAHSRVQSIAEKAAENRADIDQLKRSLSGAFDQFIADQLTGVRARYRAAALVLRDIYAEQMAWLNCPHPSVAVQDADVAIIFDSEGRPAWGSRPARDRTLLDSRNMVQRGQWEKHSGALYAQVMALRKEVIAAPVSPEAACEIDKGTPLAEASEGVRILRAAASEEAVNPLEILALTAEGRTDDGRL